jgi:hypothetical protein
VRRRFRTGRHYIPPHSPNTPLPRARRLHPITSHQAAAHLTPALKAKRIKPNSTWHRTLSPFEFASDGLAAFEAVEDSGYAHAWKRLSELRAYGLLRKTGVPRDGPDGMPQQVWLITDAGRRALVRLDNGKTWTWP